MNCEQAKLRLLRLESGGTSVDLPAALRAHLDSCSECAQLDARVRQLNGLAEAVGDVPDPGPDYFDSLSTEVLRRLPAETAPAAGQTGFWERVSGIFAWKPVFAVAAASVLIAVGWNIWQTEPDAALILPEPAGIIVPQEDELNAPVQFSEEAANTQAAGSSLRERVAKDEKRDAPSQRARAQIGNAVPVPDLKDEKAPQFELSSASRPAQGLPATSIPATTGRVDAAAGAPASPEPEADLDSRDTMVPSRSLLENKTGLSAVAKKSRADAREPAARTELNRVGDNRFTKTLRLAQAAEFHAEKAKIWRSFIANEQDSSYIRLATGYLAGPVYAMADSSRELLSIADAVTWYENHEPTLKAFLGVEDYDRQLADLRRLLQNARTQGDGVNR